MLLVVIMSLVAVLSVRQSGRAQWSDAASPPGSAPAPTAAASAASRTSDGMNDDELLAQLAEAEMEEGGLPPPRRSTNPSSAPDAPARGDESRPAGGGSSETVVDEKAASAGEGILSTAPESTLAAKREGEEASGHERGAQRKSALENEPGSAAATVAGGAGSGEISGKGSNPPPSAPEPSLEDELTQLEELERELGIVGVSGAAGKGKGAGAGSKSWVGDAGKDDSFDMENLDELEGYLESLAK